MTRDFWKEKIEKWKASNINMTEFCKREDLNYWTFRDWKSRSLQPVEPEEMTLVKLEAKPVEKQTGSAIDFYLGDIRLSVPAGFSETHLCRLISVLKKGFAMLIDIEKLAIYVKPGATDMRKQINGLAVIVEQELELDPFSGALFLFCNKQRRLLKILYWDKNGFCLWLKRLEKDRFPWPKNKGDVQQILSDQLSLLLNGIDFWNAHKSLEYTSVL